VEAADVLQVGAGNSAFFTIRLALVAAGALRGAVVVENSAAVVKVTSGQGDVIGGEGVGGVERGMVGREGRDDFRFAAFFSSFEEIEMKTGGLRRDVSQTR